MAKATKKTAQEPLPFPARAQRQMKTRTRSPNPHTVGVSTDDNANPSAWGTQSETSREAKKGARSPPRNPPSLPPSLRPSVPPRHLMVCAGFSCARRTYTSRTSSGSISPVSGTSGRVLGSLHCPVNFSPSNGNALSCDDAKRHNAMVYSAASAASAGR